MVQVHTKGDAEWLRTRNDVEKAWRTRPSAGQKLLRDSEIRGLHLVVFRDSATWRFDYKLPGAHPVTGKRWPGRKLTLGKLSPTFHLHEARAAALEAKAKVRKGVDPLTEQRVELASNLAEAANADFTVSDLTVASAERRNADGAPKPANTLPVGPDPQNWSGRSATF